MLEALLVIPYALLFLATMIFLGYFFLLYLALLVFVTLALIPASLCIDPPLPEAGAILAPYRQVLGLPQYYLTRGYYACRESLQRCILGDEEEDGRGENDVNAVVRI